MKTYVYTYLILVMLVRLLGTGLCQSNKAGSSTSMRSDYSNAQRVLVLLHDIEQSGADLQGRAKRAYNTGEFDYVVVPTYNWKDDTVPNIATDLFNRIHRQFPNAMFVIEGNGKGGLLARWIAERAPLAEGRVERLITSETPNLGISRAQLQKRFPTLPLSSPGIAELSPTSQTVQELSKPPLNNTGYIYSYQSHDYENELDLAQDSALADRAAGYGVDKKLPLWTNDQIFANDRGKYIPWPPLRIDQVEHLHTGPAHTAPTTIDNSNTTSVQIKPSGDDSQLPSDEDDAGDDLPRPETANSASSKTNNKPPTNVLQDNYTKANEEEKVQIERAKELHLELAEDAAAWTKFGAEIAENGSSIAKAYFEKKGEIEKYEGLLKKAEEAAKIVGHGADVAELSAKGAKVVNDLREGNLDEARKDLAGLAVSLSEVSIKIVDDKSAASGLGEIELQRQTMVNAFSRGQYQEAISEAAKLAAKIADKVSSLPGLPPQAVLLFKSIGAIPLLLNTVAHVWELHEVQGRIAQLKEQLKVFKQVLKKFTGSDEVPDEAYEQEENSYFIKPLTNCDGLFGALECAIIRLANMIAGIGGPHLHVEKP